MYHRKLSPLYGISLVGILLTTIYTAILASILMNTKKKVDNLYSKSNH